MDDDDLKKANEALWNILGWVATVLGFVAGYYTYQNSGLEHELARGGLAFGAFLATAFGLVILTSLIIFRKFPWQMW